MYQTDNVRVRREIADFTSTTHNVFVEEKVNGEWIVRWSTNEISNEFAYTEANNKARAMANATRDLSGDIAEMKKWCKKNYSRGADVMVECWEDNDYADLFVNAQGLPGTVADAWIRLRRLASINLDRQKDDITN